MAVLKKLGDFNDVLKCYKNMLHWSENMFSREEIFEADYPVSSVPFYRFLINNTGVSISQNFDYINTHYADSDIDNVILDVIDTLGENNSFKMDFEKLMKDNNFTPFEVLKSIRNALLHGDYDLELEQDTSRDYCFLKDFPSESGNVSGIALNGTGVKIIFKDEKSDGRKFCGKIDFSYIRSTLLEIVYEFVKETKKPKDSILYFIGNKKYASCKNRSILNQYLANLKYFKISVKSNDANGNREDIIKKFKTYLKSQTNADADAAIHYIRSEIIKLERTTGKNTFVIEELSTEESDKRKTHFKEYIEYIGFDRMEQLAQQPPEIFNAIIVEFLGCLNGDVGMSSVANLFALNIQKYAYKRMNTHLKEGQSIASEFFDDTFNKDLLIVHLYEAPLVYASTLLGMMNYSCVFLKENNTNNGINLFDYHNVPGFDSVKLSHDNTESIKNNVTSITKKDSIAKLLVERAKQASKLKSTITKLEKSINDRNPNNQFFEDSIKFEQKKLDSVNHLISILESRKASCGETYNDYTEFFRHIRNSIAHGRYTIDFSKAFKKRDFSKISFTFRDFEKNNTTTIPDFEVSLSASQIVQIIQGIMDKVNEQLQVEGELGLIESTDFFDDIMTEDEFISFQEKIRPTPSDLKDSGFITEEDQISSFMIDENIRTNEGEITVND